MSGQGAVRLTAGEREALRTSGSWPNVGADIFAAVEAILAARLAQADEDRAAVERVRALVERWAIEAEDGIPGHDSLYTRGVADMLRIALTPGSRDKP